eukprot:1144594-Pelagomonas_calceolata.AAC.1
MAENQAACEEHRSDRGRDEPGTIDPMTATHSTRQHPSLAASGSIDSNKNHSISSCSVQQFPKLRGYASAKSAPKPLHAQALAFWHTPTQALAHTYKGVGAHLQGHLNTPTQTLAHTYTGLGTYLHRH